MLIRGQGLTRGGLMGEVGKKVFLSMFNVAIDRVKCVFPLVAHVDRILGGQSL